MQPNTLDLPLREAKPRTRGTTMVIDPGLPTGYFTDAMTSVAEYVDVVKFGWGTCLVTPDLNRKLALLRDLNIDYYFGGTLFEKYLAQDRFDEFRLFCHRHGCRYVEVSNGTIELSEQEKASYVAKLVDDFTVLSEVGYKDGEKSERMSPSIWVSAIRADLDAGARYVITEARESGSSGICRPDGGLRFGLVEDILVSGIPVDRLLFEAPTKTLQTYFVRRVGSDVNLGNVAVADIIACETLRLGLRSDTLFEFEPAAS